MIYLPMQTLTKEESKLLQKFLIKNWSFFIMGILLIAFQLSQENKLIVGGILLLFIGIKIYLLEAIKQKKSSYFLYGAGSIYMGIVSILTQFLLPKMVDAFILLMFLVFISLLLIYLLLRSNLAPSLQILISLFITILIIVMIKSMDSTISSINKIGFTNNILYWTVILFLFFLVLLTFTVIKTIFTLIQKKVYDTSLLNNYFYSALSVMIITLSYGYFYIMNISENKLRDFFIIISISFVTSFVGASAIKNLGKN